MLIKPIQQRFTPLSENTFEEEQRYLDSLEKVLNKQSVQGNNKKIDPNSLSYFQWMDLGASSDLSNEILKTKKRIGGFKCLYQFKNVKGVSSSSLTDYYNDLDLPLHCPKQPTSKTSFEVNSVTKKQLQTLTGLSHKIAQRIINYRSSLGGYYSLNQLSEVHKISSAELKILKAHLSVQKSKIKKIRINTAKYHQLKKHPYLTGKQASTIINYRKKIKKYTSLQELEKVYNLEPKECKKNSALYQF